MGKKCGGYSEGGGEGKWYQGIIFKKRLPRVTNVMQWQPHIQTKTVRERSRYKKRRHFPERHKNRFLSLLFFLLLPLSCLALDMVVSTKSFVLCFSTIPPPSPTPLPPQKRLKNANPPTPRLDRTPPLTPLPIYTKNSAGSPFLSPFPLPPNHFLTQNKKPKKKRFGTVVTPGMVRR